MAARTAEISNPFFAFVLEIRIVHERGIGIGRRLHLLQGDEVAGDILGIRNGKPEARHHGHVLHLEFVSVVGAFAVIEIVDGRQSLLLVVFGIDVFLLLGSEGARALVGVVDLANLVIIIGFFSFALEIGVKRFALLLAVFAK